MTDERACLRKNLKKAEETEKRSLERAIENRKRITALLELLSPFLIRRLNPYFTHKLRFYGEEGDTVREFRSELRRAFMTWSDEVTHVQARTKEMAEVTYTGTHNGQAVEFSLETPVADLYEAGVLKETCVIEEQVSPESRYLAVVCK